VKRRLRVIIPLLLVVAVSLAFWVATRDHAAGPTGKIVGNGTIETTEVDVTSRVPAKLVAAPFQEGDWVRLGERVAVLDNADLAAQVGQAEAASEAAQANLDELLAGTRSEEITRARAQYQGALDAENQAQAKLDLVRAGTRTE
jgi:multidrug efflux pump subunit AcrA (membrane-fusion protein)